MCRVIRVLGLIEWKKSGLHRSAFPLLNNTENIGNVHTTGFGGHLNFPDGEGSRTTQA